MTAAGRTPAELVALVRALDQPGTGAGGSASDRDELLFAYSALAPEAAAMIEQLAAELDATTVARKTAIAAAADWQHRYEAIVATHATDPGETPA